MKTLQIISEAYRGTIEEQDDTILWICSSMQKAGAEMSLLLKNDAVNYIVRGQKVPQLTFGEWKQSHPPTIDADVATIIKADVDVYALKEDLEERGINQKDILAGVKLVARAELPALMDNHGQVWNW